MDESITIGAQILAEASNSDPRRYLWLCRYGMGLLLRSDMRDGKYREDLKTAIKHISRALKLFPAGRPQVERLTLMCVLGSGLRKWFDTSGKQNLAQIKQSISILQAPPSIIEGPHVFWAEVYYRLGESRLSSARYHKSRGLESDDIAEALTCFTECLHSLRPSPSLQIQGAIWQL